MSDEPFLVESLHGSTESTQEPEVWSSLICQLSSLHRKETGVWEGLCWVFASGDSLVHQWWRTETSIKNVFLLIAYHPQIWCCVETWTIPFYHCAGKAVQYKVAQCQPEVASIKCDPTWSWNLQGWVEILIFPTCSCHWPYSTENDSLNTVWFCV